MLISYSLSLAILFFLDPAGILPLRGDLLPAPTLILAQRTLWGLLQFFLGWIFFTSLGGGIFRLFRRELTPKRGEGTLFLGLTSFGLLGVSLSFLGFPPKIPLFTLTLPLAFYGWKEVYRNALLSRLPPLFLASLIPILLVLPASLAPSIDFDGQVYHLQGFEAILAGKVGQFLESSPHANIPLLGESLWLWGEGFSEGFTSRAAHLLVFFGVIHTGSLFAGGGRFGMAGMTLLVLSIPELLRNCGNAYVDIFFTWGLFQFAWGLFERREIWAGYSLGIALSTKYTALYLLLGWIGAFFILRVYFKGKGHPPPLKGIGLALLLFSPWPLKNLAHTGNPVFPVHNGLFYQTPWSQAPLKQKRLQQGWYSEGQPFGELTYQNFLNRFGRGKKLEIVSLLPWWVGLRGRWNTPKTGLQYFDGYPGFAWLILFPLALIPFFMGGVSVRLTFGITLVLFLSGSQQVRFLLPLFLLFSAIGLSRIPPPNRKLLLLILLPCSLFGIHQYLKCMEGFSLGDYFSGTLSREDYLTRNLPYLPLYGELNRIRKDGELAWHLLEPRSYGLNPPSFWSDLLGLEVVEVFLNSENRQQILQKLSEREISWLGFKKGVPEILSRDLPTEQREGILEFFSLGKEVLPGSEYCTLRVEKQ